jgi:5'(3')-deoxyribonucleotidase
MKNCYIDLDGVLVDWFSGICKTHTGLKAYYEVEARRGTNDFHTFLPSTKQPDKTMSKGEFWEPFEHDFWANLKWTSWGRDLLKLLEDKFGKENCYVCTALPQNFGAGSGKMEWLKRNMPDYFFKGRYFLTKMKWHLAHNTGSYLFDDKPSNISRFLDVVFEKRNIEVDSSLVSSFSSPSGGAYLIPGYWNSEHEEVDNIIPNITEFLKEV